MIPGVITPPEYIRTNTVHMYAHRWERFPHTARGAMAAVVRSAFSCWPARPLLCVGLWFVLVVVVGVRGGIGITPRHTGRE